MLELPELLAGEPVVQGLGTPGRELDEVGSGGLFRVGSLVLYGEPPLYVGARSVEMGSRDEVFPIGVERFDPARHWSRPALQPIEALPPDLALAPLLGTPLRAEILATPEIYFADHTAESVLVDTAVLFSASSGERLLIESRHEPVEGSAVPVMPLDLLLTCRADTIDERLARGWTRPPSRRTHPSRLASASARASSQTSSHTRPN